MDAARRWEGKGFPHDVLSYFGRRWRCDTAGVFERFSRERAAILAAEEQPAVEPVEPAVVEPAKQPAEAPVEPPRKRTLGEEAAAELDELFPLPREAAR